MTAESSVVSIGLARQRREQARELSRLYTVADVSAHCGLPAPVVMQLVERTWTDRGWMFTSEQLLSSAAVATELRRRNASRPPTVVQGPLETLMCDGCGEVVAAEDGPRAGWLNAAAPDPGPGGDPLGRDYCPRCLVPCPSCPPDRSEPNCDICCGAGNVIKRL